jgi:hypothetical protein
MGVRRVCWFYLSDGLTISARKCFFRRPFAIGNAIHSDRVIRRLANRAACSQRAYLCSPFGAGELSNRTDFEYQVRALEMVFKVEARFSLMGGLD